MERVLEITVKVNQAKTEIIEEKDNYLKVSLRAKPVEGEANQELIKFLKKKFKADVEIIRGITSNKKLIRMSWAK
jgi:uncharacterized protein (TIGR00251 family)